MKRTLTVLGMTIILLAVLDGMVALTLGLAEQTGRLSALTRYFEYGRSVPGKLAKWDTQPDMPGNLYDIAWRSEAITGSRAQFLNEPADQKPVIRSYGMSFVNNIIRNAVELQPDLTWDNHAGPGAPPNFTYALFQDDRANRRPDDIVVLGILSSAVPAMAALSNSTWVFEQPAPFTYPIYWPEEGKLRRVEPLVNSAARQRSLSDNATIARDWYDQLSREDAFYAFETFGATWLDVSPFARLVRRSLAISHVERTKANILQGTRYPYASALQKMIAEFAQTTRDDNQIPVVMLIQSRNPMDADLLAIAKPVLDQEDIPYLATVDYFDPTDLSGFLPDGHYKSRIDRIFAEHFINLISP